MSAEYDQAEATIHESFGLLLSNNAIPHRVESGNPPLSRHLTPVMFEATMNPIGANASPRRFTAGLPKLWDCWAPGER
jgi:hypothetical protein